jgi:hypothetical protein
MITLYQQIFKCTPEVESYNLYCLNKNLKNKFINKIVLFFEKKCDIPLFDKEKIEFVEVNKRISYKDWIDFSKKNKGVKILANSDVYLDETVGCLLKIEWKNTLVILSRKDLTKKGEIIESEVFHNSGKKINPKCSQDAWAYKDNLREFYCDFKLGYWHCESRFRTAAIENNINVKNLTNYINVIHVDWRNQEQKEKDHSYSYSNSKIKNLPLHSEKIFL